MTERRSRGDGGLSWDLKRQRWIASVTVGYTPAGKRIFKRASGKTKTEAKNKLKDILRDYEDGLAVATGTPRSRTPSPTGSTTASRVVTLRRWSCTGTSPGST